MDYIVLHRVILEVLEIGGGIIIKLLSFEIIFCERMVQDFGMKRMSPSRWAVVFPLMSD